MTKPDPSLLEGVVAAEVLEAMRVASKALAAAGVRHLVVGGLAVSAYGYPRATRHVDFLVGDEARRHKDRTDVIELIKSGLDVDSCRAFLTEHAPSFVASFDDAVERARLEDE